MNAVIDRFGRIVGGGIIKNPKRSLQLLRAGYFLSGEQMKYLPDRRLLPHQRYASVISNRMICTPLARPQNSAVVSAFLPCELLHAMNITPQFVEGLSCYLNGAGSEGAFIRYAEASGVPQTYCSYHKTLLGAALSGVLPAPRFVVNTTLACDANCTTFRTLSDAWDVPQYVVDVPRGTDRNAVAYVAEQLRELAVFLERETGEKLQPDRLKAAVRRGNHSMRLYREALSLLSHKYLPNDMTSEMYKIFFTHVLLGTEESEQYFHLLRKDLRKAAPAGDEIRILWAHSLPFWQDSFKNLFNFSKRYQLLSCDLNLDFISEVSEENPYEAMAQRVILSALGGPSERRVEKLLQTARLLHADGVIYFCHWGCKQTLGGAYPAKERLEQADIPTLILDGDGCDRGNVNDGQMNTRVQAFLEILEHKK